MGAVHAYLGAVMAEAAAEVGVKVGDLDVASMISIQPTEVLEPGKWVEHIDQGERAEQRRARCRREFSRKRTYRAHGDTHLHTLTKHIIACEFSTHTIPPSCTFLPAVRHTPVVPIQGIKHSSAESGATSAVKRKRTDHGKSSHARPSRYVREVRNSMPTTSFVMQLTGLLTPLIAQM
jgi:hypothetical protein